MGSIRVLVADDHRLVRSGIAAFVEAGEHDIEIVGEAEDMAGLDAFLADGSGWDVLVLDLFLPDGLALDTIESIVSRFPDRAVLVLSSGAEEDYGPRALRAGARGYLHKDCAHREVVAAIETVHRGEHYVRPALAGRLVEFLHDRSIGPPHDRLSPREFQVLVRTASGRSLKEIAAELSVATKTVSSFRSRISQKLGLYSTAALTRYCLEHDLLP